MPPEHVPGPSRRAAIASLLRAVGTSVVLGAIYFVVPLTEVATSADLAVLVAAVAALPLLVLYETKTILRADYPGLRAMEALGVCVPVLLIAFALAYYLMAHRTPGAFGQPLTRLDALYFTVTVFGTVGFGDITAHSQAARAVVTLQILTDLTFLGVAVRLITGAVSISRRRTQS